MKLFITGTWRTGSTLISQIFNSHSNITVTYDSLNFMRFAYMKYGQNKITYKQASCLGKDMNNRLCKRFNNGFDIEKYDQKIKNKKVIQYSFLYDLIMKLYTGNNNWGEKTVLQWRNAESVIEMFKDIYIIHCIRDPRDVMASWKNHTIAKGNDYMDAISNCYDSMKYAIRNEEKFKDKYIVCVFEKLLKNPEKIVSEMCSKIGIEYEEQMINTRSFKNKVTNEEWNKNSAFNDSIKGISNKPIGRWENHLLEDDIILCELTNKTLMQHFGYTLSDIQLSIKNVHNAIAKISQSPLAYNGILQITDKNEGVQRFPLDEFDSSTWEVNIANL